MSRALTLALVASICSPLLVAQAPDETDQPIVVEMTIERSLAPDNNGVADILDGVYADELVLTYVLVNDTNRDIEIAPKVDLSEHINCAARVTAMPAEYLIPGEQTTMVIEVAPESEGPFSFRVSMLVGQDEYSYDVHATVVELLHGDDHHCHWWGCHSHHHHDHHCSTTEGTGLAMGALLGVVFLALTIRRTRKPA